MYEGYLEMTSLANGIVLKCARILQVVDVYKGYCKTISLVNNNILNYLQVHLDAALQNNPLCRYQYIKMFANNLSLIHLWEILEDNIPNKRQCIKLSACTFSAVYL